MRDGRIATKSVVSRVRDATEKPLIEINLPQIIVTPLTPKLKFHSPKAASMIQRWFFMPEMFMFIMELFEEKKIVGKNFFKNQERKKKKKRD